ncbi:MAG: MFS transporter [Candidatus Omnitrophica bacterium]|nr:MFS transporter [Candidatus Omnitrophota bacterium]
MKGFFLNTFDKGKASVYFLLCLGCVTISFNTAAIAAVIPSISKDLGISDFAVSRMISFYMIPYGLGALIYAPLLKVISYRKVLASTMLLYAISCALCSIGNLLNNLLLARMAMGLSGAAVTPMALMIIGDNFDSNIRGRLVGVFFSCSFFASLAGIGIASFADWRALFYIPALLALVITIVSLLMKSEIFDRSQTGEVNYIRVFTNKRIRNVFLFIFVISALYHGVHQWYGVYLDKVYGLSKQAISLIFILSAVGGLVGQNIGGMLSDKKNRLFACYTGFIVLSLSTLLLSLHFPVIIVAAVMVFISIGWTISHNGISTLLTDFPEEERALTASLNSAVRFISGGIGFYLSTYIVASSFATNFFIIGIVMFILVFLIKYIIISVEHKNGE